MKSRLLSHSQSCAPIWMSNASFVVSSASPFCVKASYMHPNNPSNGDPLPSLWYSTFNGSRSRCSSTLELSAPRSLLDNRVLLTSLLGSNSVDRVIRITLSSNSTANGNGGRLTFDGLSIGVNVGDLDLDRSVVLGVDQSVCEIVRISQEGKV